MQSPSTVGIVAHITLRPPVACGEMIMLHPVVVGDHVPLTSDIGPPDRDTAVARTSVIGIRYLPWPANVRHAAEAKCVCGAGCLRDWQLPPPP